jgi:hypothetical protein
MWVLNVGCLHMVENSNLVYGAGDTRYEVYAGWKILSELDHHAPSPAPSQYMGHSLGQGASGISLG